MAFVPPLSRAVIVRVFVNDECTNESVPATVTIENLTTGSKKTDSVTISKKEFQYVVMNSDYGKGKDAGKTIKYRITAENSNYGKK